MVDKMLIHKLSRELGVSADTIQEYLKDFAWRSTAMIPEKKIYEKMPEYVIQWGCLTSIGNKMLDAYCIRGHKELLPVRFNYLWAREIVSNYYDENVIISATITIGHEYNHMLGDFAFKTHDILEKQFINWCIEVHNDFGAAMLYHYKRQPLIISCRHKQQYKITHVGYDHSSLTHPSWTQRLEYVNKYDFDESLLKQIAKDVYKERYNEKDETLIFLIQEILNYYGVIKLQGKLKLKTKY